MSGAVSLVGMALFSLTGITLNHAADIEAEPRVSEREGRLPEPLAAELAAAAETEPAALPEGVAAHLARELGAPVRGRPAEWSGVDVYVGLPRPGGDAWLSVDLADGAYFYERTDRGAIAFLNDLHKARHTGGVWAWFIDVFAVAALVFCLTGLALLYLQARREPLTWPLTAFGLALPVLLVVFFIHL